MSELTDDELNERIYEAQGYEKLGFPAVPTWQKPSGDGLPRGLYHEPKYATDLNAAFELVREAEAQNVGFSLHNVTYENGERITYEATFYDPWGGPMCEEYTVEAPTPARAISECWLQWHEAKNLNNSRAVQPSRGAQDGDGNG